MPKLTDEMKQVLKIVGKGGAVLHLTTCSADGKPNIVAERFVSHYKDEYIIIADMYAQKTKVNLNENEIGAISVAHPAKGHTWVFRGPCTIIQWGHPGTGGLPGSFVWQGVRAGELLAEWGNWAEKEPPDEVPPDIRPPLLVQRGVIILKVDEAYSWNPEEAGKKIL